MEVMRMLLDGMCECGVIIVKLVVTPKTPEDVLRLLAVTSEFHCENKETPIITVAMGKLGKISRVSGETFGSCVTFASHKKKSAPGQFDLEEMRRTIDMMHQVCE